MTIQFSLKYRTVWGEQIILRIGKRSFGMRYTRDGMWETSLSAYEIRKGQKYTYEVNRDGKTVRTEWRTHSLRLPEGVRDAVIRDRWIDRPANSTFWSSAFKDVIFGREPADPKEAKGNVILRTTAPEIRPGEALAVTGSGRALGNWKKVNILDDSRFPYWEIGLDAAEPFE